MTFSVQHAVRRVNWDLNKRSFQAAARLGPDILAEARSLHGRGDYERSIEVIQSTPGWQSDPSAWRLVGLCWQGLAQHEEETEKKNSFLEQARHALDQDKALHATEIAKADVNIAASYIAQRLYDEAMKHAVSARSGAPFLATPHICILAIYRRTGDADRLKEYVQALLDEHAWIFDDPDFNERLANDTDLQGVQELVHSLGR